MRELSFTLSTILFDSISINFYYITNIAIAKDNK